MAAGALAISMFGTGAAWSAVPATGSGDPIEWIASADTYVNASAPTRVYGASDILRADGKPAVRSYVRFVVSGAPAGPQRTVLRIRHWTADPQCALTLDCQQKTRVAVRRVSATDWSEQTTYASAPAVGDVVGVSDPVVTTGPAWTDIELGALVSGDGVYELAITGSSSVNNTFASRESASPPRLVVFPSASAPGTGEGGATTGTGTGTTPGTGTGEAPAAGGSGGTAVPGANAGTVLGVQAFAAPPSLKKGKSVKLAATTFQGSKLTWKSASRKTCKVTLKKKGRNKGRYYVKAVRRHAVCKLAVNAPAVTAFSAVQVTKPVPVN